MGVNHGGANIRMTQQFLYCPDIIAFLKQMGCKAVPESMGGDAFADLTLPNSFANGFG
jgi:hypothetical protein